MPLLADAALKDWKQAGPGKFTVENGVATASGGMGLWWYTGRQFTNFVLRGEFVQEQPIADSGVFVRFPDPGNDPWVAVKRGHEFEIGDPAPERPDVAHRFDVSLQGRDESRTRARPANGTPSRWSASDTIIPCASTTRS